MIKKVNLVGVGDVEAYSGDVLVLKSKAMLNTTVEISTGSTEIAGGKRNKLQNIYYHSGRLNLTLENTQWDMNWVKANVGGSDINWISKVQESVAISAAGVGTVVNFVAVPLMGSTQAYGFITKDDGSNVRVVIGNDGSFTTTDAILFSTNVCVEYYAFNPNAESVSIPASIIPDRLNIFINVDLAGNTSGEGLLGYTEFNIPSAQLSGAQTINMTSDGYSTIPLSAMALAFTPPTTGANACQNAEVYAVVTTVLYNTNWYDNVTGLGIDGGDFNLKVGTTKQLNIIALTSDGKTKPVPKGALTYESETKGTATVVSTGVVTAVGAGKSLITAKITAKPLVDASCTVTVTA